MNQATGPEVEDQVDQADRCEEAMVRDLEGADTGDHPEVVDMAIEVDTVVDEVATEEVVGAVMERTEEGTEAIGEATEAIEEDERHLLLDDIHHAQDHPFENDPVLRVGEEGGRTLGQATPVEAEAIREVEVQHRGGKRGVSPEVDQDQGRGRGHQVHHPGNDPSREAGAGASAEVGAGVGVEVQSGGGKAIRGV